MKDEIIVRLLVTFPTYKMQRSIYYWNSLWIIEFMNLIGFNQCVKFRIYNVLEKCSNIQYETVIKVFSYDRIVLNEISKFINTYYHYSQHTA